MWLNTSIIPRIFASATIFCWFALSNGIYAAQEKVILTNVFHRHGDRSLTLCLPKATSCPEHWPDGFGQLTARGLNETNILGQYLNARYITDMGLIDVDYSPLDIYVRSTDYDRTLMSVTSVLEGLYPPGTGARQHNGAPGMTKDYITAVPIHTVPTSEDGLLRSFESQTCTDFDKAQEDEVSAHQKAWDEAEKKAAPIISKLEQYTGVTGIKLSNLYMVYDSLNVMREWGYEWPAGVTQELFDTTDELNRWAEFHMFNSPTLKKQSSGLMTNLLRNRLTAAAKGLPQPGFNPNNYPEGHPNGPKMYIYSAHDTTLVALLYGLSAKTAPFKNPPYSSSVAIELVQENEFSHSNMRRTQSSYDGYYVRMYYNPGIGSADKTGSGTAGPVPFAEANLIVIEGCQKSVVNGSLCPLDVFLQATDANAINQQEWLEICGKVPSSADKNNLNITSGGLAGIIIGSVIFGALAVGFITFIRRKRQLNDEFAYQPTSEY